ncbi:hypothetical protein JOC78_001328 [Bacillus ectoiniformans]|uniref:SWIM zinc finger family protein n=1 Tax=Bacillus ectoiniformans TaxID=1494429 RepID=UPI00195A221D|nr:SWIM zinc finger family protein [Bacillus ectoiniformans]MBM7648386.1 hypothetical protein [Bacillus ectoiniformans]
MAGNEQVLRKRLDSFGSELKVELSPALPGDARIMEDGFRMFTSPAVSLEQMDSDSIEASCNIMPGQKYKVSLDLGFPSFSTCTCAEEYWCVHQVAVFLEAYHEYGSVHQWMKDWRNNDSSEDLLSGIPGIMKASELLAKKPAENDGPQSWMERIHQTAEEKLHARMIERNPHMIEFEGKNLYEALLKQRPLKREWQPLYQLFSSFGLFTYVMNVLDHQTESKEFMHRAASSFLFYLVEEAADAAEEIGVHALPFEFDFYMDYLREETGELLSSRYQLFTVARTDMYRHLWTSLFKREAWRKQEMNRLKGLVDSDKSPSVTIAYLHQLLLTNRLDDFSKMADTLPEAELDLYMFWLYEAFSSKQYKKALMLLSIADKKLEGYIEKLPDGYQRRQFVHWFLTYIDVDWLASKEPVLYKNILMRLLPYSYVDLSTYVLSQGDYREWVELQLWMNYDLMELDTMGLKEAAKQAPHEVLPIYHHGILRLVEERNRESYKRAVRYLKRLRTIYKKLKQQERWDWYFSALLNDTKRLRAFQEECRRGKLVDA